jgi:hypothetical protein
MERCAVTPRLRPKRPAVESPTLFEPREYLERDIDFQTAWSRLPVVEVVGGVGVRWVGPLVELGLDTRLGDLANAAYGHLEDCGWEAALRAGGPVRASGRQATAYARAFANAVRMLAAAGLRAGPEADPEVWAAWIAFEMDIMHARIHQRAARRGWAR